MSSGILHTAQIRERLKLLKEKGRLPGVAAFFAPDMDADASGLSFDGEEVEIRRCDSVLAIRDFLASRPQNNPSGAKMSGDPTVRPQSQTAVLLTRVPYEDMGADVLARLAGRKLFRADSWSAVMSRYHAVNLDPRLVREGWIADLLLLLPSNDFPAVPNGYLTIETVWQTLLTRLIGLEDERSDAVALLRWLMLPGSIDRYCATEENFRTGFGQWAEITGGEAGRAIAECIAVTRNTDAIAVGLVLDVLNQPAENPDPNLRICAVRLERLHGNRPLSQAAASIWANAARTVIEQQPLDSKPINQLLKRADELLTNIDAGSFAYKSDLSPMGFIQRTERYAKAVLSALAQGEINDEEPAASLLRRHRGAHGKTGQRVIMSGRLLRWLAGKNGAAPPIDLPQAAVAYLNCGAWIDWARTLLRGGEAHAPLSHAYEALLERVRTEREKENHRFGKLLVEWNAGAPRHESVVPVEEVVERVVAPLAAKTPVLMLVLDGVSGPVFYEFLDNFNERTATILGRKIGKQVLPITPGIAAIPSITEVSRASLLAGKLTRGNSRAEKELFASNAALLQVSRARRPPMLFHKGELTEPGGTELSAIVREAIGASEQRVVGVVVNAIDDHLSGPDQVRPEWTIDYLSPQIKALLDEAEAAGRIVIFTGDHGHVLDADTELRPSGHGDRWRDPQGEPEVGELVVSGGRLDAGYGSKVITPWSERVRYGPRKNGYHGGISPQEMVVPICVMARLGTKLDGWVESWPVAPSWWDATPPTARQGTLFADAKAPAKPIELEWLDRLLKSETFKAQRQSAGSGAAHENQVRQTLQILATHGGRMSESALAHRLGLAPARMGPRIAAIRRLLNIEGYQALAYDYESQTVTLDIELLLKQFEI